MIKYILFALIASITQAQDFSNFSPPPPDRNFQGEIQLLHGLHVEDSSRSLGTTHIKATYFPWKKSSWGLSAESEQSGRSYQYPIPSFYNQQSSEILYRNEASYHTNILSDGFFGKATLLQLEEFSDISFGGGVFAELLFDQKWLWNLRVSMNWGVLGYLNEEFIGDLSVAYFFQKQNGVLLQGTFRNMDWVQYGSSRNITQLFLGFISRF